MERACAHSTEEQQVTGVTTNKRIEEIAYGRAVKEGGERNRHVVGALAVATGANLRDKAGDVLDGNGAHAASQNTLFPRAHQRRR